MLPSPVVDGLFGSVEPTSLPFPSVPIKYTFVNVSMIQSSVTTTSTSLSFECPDLDTSNSNKKSYIASWLILSAHLFEGQCAGYFMVGTKGGLQLLASANT